MRINKHHGSFNRSRRYGLIKYIVIHYTATTAPALNNCRYFAGGDRGASADYFVDDSGVWEYNDPSEGWFTWAVGDGGGAFGITNDNSISIEVVNAGGRFSEAEVGHLCELVPYLMERYGVPASRVVRHYDASRKACPAGYVDQAAWASLHKRITGGAMGGWIQEKSGKRRWWYRNADGSYTKSGWQMIDGLWYFFDSEGWMRTGWLDWKGARYYLQPESTKDFKEGQMRTGWIKFGESWRYFKDDGALARSECLKVKGAWYAFNADGIMKTAVKVDASGALRL